MLPRRYKLKKDNDFKKVFKQGKHYQSEFIGVKALKNNLKTDRFAFIVGIKTSKKAVERNRVKRRLEEIVRLHLEESFKKKSNFDIVVMVKPEIVDKTYQQIKEKLISSLEKIWEY